MAGSLGAVAVTAGSGTNIEVVSDSGGNKHPVGVMEFVDASLNPIQVSAANPMPVTASSLPLPTGASTEATLTAVSDKLPTTLDGSGGLKVAIVSGGGSGGTASSFGSAFPASGTAIGAKDSTGTNMVPLNLDASGFLKVNVAAGGSGGGAVTQSGTWTVGLSTGAQVELTDGTNVLGSSAHPIRTDPTGTTTQPISGTVSITGTVAVASVGGSVEITNDAGNPIPVSGTVTANIGSALPAGTNTIGGVFLQPTTSGGLSTYSLSSAATTNATNVKNSAGQLYGYAIYNTSAAAKYVRFYDSATAPTAGSGTPVRRLLIPAGGGVERAMPNGLQFASGIGFTITGANGDADTTAVASGDVLLNIDYK